MITWPGTAVAVSADCTTSSAGVSTATVTRHAVPVLPGGQVDPELEDDTLLVITLPPVSGLCTVMV